jgi:hypothetical protein
MKRRTFGLLAGTSLATAATHGAARAQSATPDPTLLTTTLTPMGAERAGNADGSIPAWTGGITAPPTAPDQDAQVPSPFDNEQMLYRVDASNLSQYSALVTPGVQLLINKFGSSLRVFPSHRTAAAPQYVYDNIAKNVTTAKLDPRGGRYGFTGGYGGIPFPIIDTSDPYVGGAQLIWNHLTHWEGYSIHNTFAPAIVVSQGQTVLTAGEDSRTLYPYYDPNGSLETYQGYFSLNHLYEAAPAGIVGQEDLIWNSTNVNIKPNIIWILLNGQARVRKAPNDAFDAPNALYNGIQNVDELQGFYSNPVQYDWKYITKQEMLLPYNNNAINKGKILDLALPNGPNPEMIRWEKHRVWVLEANLNPDSHNVLPHRRFYIDEDTGQIVLGESYDADGNLARVYLNPLRFIPSVPMTSPAAVIGINPMTGDYFINGSMLYKNFSGKQLFGPEAATYFEPQQMAASSSF